MRKISRWRIGLVVLALLLIVLFSANYLLQRKIEGKLSDLDGIQIEEIDCSLIQNTIDLTTLDIDIPSIMGMTGEAESIQIAGIDRLEYFRSGALKVAEIIIEAGELYFDLAAPTDSISGDSLGTPSFQIDEFVLRNSNVHVLDGQVQVAILEDVSFRIHDLQFDVDSNFSWKDYFIRTGKIVFQPQGNNHELEIESAFYNPDDQQAVFSEVRLFTQVPAEMWYSKVKKKQSRFDFKGRKIEIARPNLRSWIKHRKIDIGNIVVHEGQLEVFEDKRFEHCSTCKVKLPHQSLQTSSIAINIDSFQMKNSHVTYLSREKSKTTLGRLEFSNVYASTYHLSNTPKAIATHPHLFIDAHAMLFESTPLAVHLDFDLTSANGSYTYKGEIGGFKLVQLNDFLSPVKHIAIGSGKSLKTMFRARGDAYKSAGDMNFSYEDLKIQFLSKNKNSKRIVSGLLNELAIKRHNIRNVKFRNGVIYHQRDQSRSIFHSLSQSLQSGIKSSVLSKHLLPEELRLKNK